MIEKLKCEDFAALVDEKFVVEADPDTTLEMELLEATELGGPALDRTPFSVIFRSPETDPLPQRIYRVKHEKLGPMDLFLVPLGPDGEGMRYEAVFT